MAVATPGSPHYVKILKSPFVLSSIRVLRIQSFPLPSVPPLTRLDRFLSSSFSSASLVALFSPQLLEASTSPIPSPATTAALLRHT